MDLTPMGTELVVLVDDRGRQIGTAPKETVHGKETPLHRAFSCYLFDDNGQVLITRRALGKATFPGLWTNSVCGHPGPGETDLRAVRRRSRHELGVDIGQVTPALPQYRYDATFLGVRENEICPVYLARLAPGEIVRPLPSEVEEIRWMTWEAFTASLRRESGYSPWCHEQASLLHDLGLVDHYLTNAYVSARR